MVKLSIPRFSRAQHAALTLAVFAGLGTGSLAHAAEPELGSSEAAADASAAATLDLSAPPVEDPSRGHPDDSGALLLAGKVGGIMPLDGLDPFVSGGAELGWIFAGTHQRIAALLDVTYSAPHASGKAADARLAGQAFEWELRQKELILQPTFLYRLTGLGPVVPFAGIGPRIYFLETVGEGSAAGVGFSKTDERSTKFGAGLPVGAEYVLGPGGLMAELLLEWAPIDHRITGDASLTAATLFVGYRAAL